MNLTGRDIFQKADRVTPDRDRLDRIHDVPCCICVEFGMVQLSPTQAHHCIHGRYSARKAPDRMTICICEGHHQGLRDISKVALHQEPSEWKRLYGKDTDWISWTDKMLGLDDGEAET